MRFYSDKECSEHVWTGTRLVTFENGIIETQDKELIDLLTKAGYRKDGADGRETEQGDTKRQTIKKKPATRTKKTT